MSRHACATILRLGERGQSQKKCRNSQKFFHSKSSGYPAVMPHAGNTTKTTMVRVRLTIISLIIKRTTTVKTNRYIAPLTHAVVHVLSHAVVPPVLCKQVKYGFLLRRQHFVECLRVRRSLAQAVSAGTHHGGHLFHFCGR